MKKINYVIFAFISIFSFFMLFNEAEITSIDNIKNVESTLNNSYRIIIPNTVTNMDQKKVYELLKENLDKYQGSIYYSRAEKEIINAKTIDKEIKYVYFNSLDYFNALSLSEGRSFELDKKESNLFLSTDKTDESNQIGRIASINKDCKVEVHTLSKLIDKGLFDGYCFVQLPQNSDINEFINDLNKSFDTESVKIMKNSNHEEYKNSYKWIVIFGLYFFCMLIMVYDILKSYKKIAIKKMLGFSKKNIYLSNLKNLVLVQILIQALITLILCLVKFESYNKYVSLFLKNLIEMYAIELIMLIIAITLPYIYINKIKISNMLKNKQPTKEILVFNTAVKIIIIIAFFIISKSIMQDFNSFKNVYSKSFEKWDQMSEYVVLPSIENATSDYMAYMASEKSLNEQRQIYTYFNKKGAIFANFSEFLTKTRKIRLDETTYPYESDNVWVNPNYLKLNPIYDVDGNIVNISENEEKEIIMVPEKYKSYENDIIKKHKWWNEPNNRDVSIIWIQDGQSIFTYNLDVNIDEGNCVTDSFVNVRTEANGYGYEYAVIMGYTGNPFKIKLDPNLSIDENVRPELDKYGYSQHVTKISRVNEMVASDSYKIKEKMYMYLGTALLVGISLILVLVQSVFNFFNQYKQYLAIRHLHGYGIGKKYQEYFSLILSSWFIISAIIYAFGIIDLYFQIKLSLILILFELILSIIVLIIRNKKNITIVIKGS